MTKRKRARRLAEQNESTPLPPPHYHDLGGGLILKTEHVRHESFRYTVPGYGDVRWDVTVAQQLVTAGHTRALVPISVQTTREIAERNTWDPAKLDHVDPSIPGICAPLVKPDDPGGPHIYSVLIDGTHRCARAARDGLPFSAYLLTDDAARACVIDGPAVLLPWSYRSQP